jgi:hypothetical protein
MLVDKDFDAFLMAVEIICTFSLKFRRHLCFILHRICDTIHVTANVLNVMCKLLGFTSLPLKQQVGILLFGQ